MNQTPEVKFQFVNFLIKESHFVLNNAGEYDFTLSFDPSGVLLPSLGQFHLQLGFTAQDANNLVYINLVAVAIFQYEGIDNIVDSQYFTVNASAIAFPYLRAYISTLTIQSGIPPIILPTLNLSGLADLLRQNIKVAE